MLEEGQTYQIDLKGLDTGDGGLPDPWVSLFDSGDNYLTDNIGGGVGRNSRITYTVPPGQGGTFYITAASDLLISETGNGEGHLHPHHRQHRQHRADGPADNFGHGAGRQGTDGGDDEPSRMPTD